MTEKIRDFGLVLALILNFYILKEIKNLYSLSMQYASVPSNVDLILKKQLASIDPTQAANAKTHGAVAENTMSDANIMALVKKSVNEEIALLTSKSGSFDKQPDAIKLRQIQERIDMFQKKFSERLGIKGSLAGADNDKLKAIADRVKEEVLSQCKK